VGGNELGEKVRSAGSISDIVEDWGVGMPMGSVLL
jgi:hypothetical protein